MTSSEAMDGSASSKRDMERERNDATVVSDAASQGLNEILAPQMVSHNDNSHLPKEERHEIMMLVLVPVNEFQ
jgi:hypothetical protein